MSGEDRVAWFRDDVAASPDALAALLDAWRPVDLRGPRRVLLAGLGSSRYAALVVAAAARGTGRDVVAEYAGPAGGMPPADDLLTVCISASGGTSEVVDVAEAHRARSLVVAVTNAPGSRLARAADVVVPLHAGTETAGISCRTYRATLAVLALLLDVADVASLRAVVPALRAASEGTPWRRDAADLLDGAPAIDVVAPAALLGAAGQAALMLREAPRLPAHAVETADWAHTHVYLALPGHRVLRFSGSHGDAELEAIVTRRGGRVIGLPPLPQGTPEGTVERAIVDSIVVEHLAAELWARASAQELHGAPRQDA